MKITIDHELNKMIEQNPNERPKINGILHDISSLLEPSYYHSTLYLKSLKDYLVLDVKTHSYISQEVQRDIIHQFETIIDKYNITKMTFYINGYNNN